MKISRKNAYLGAKFFLAPCFFMSISTFSWEQRKLGEVIEESYNGQTPSRANDEYWNGDLNWLASGDLNRGIVTHTTEKITNKGLEDTRLRIVPKGTFVMAITGLEAAGTRGNCGILGIDTALNQSCMALFPNKKILDTKFLFQWYRKVGEEYGINYTQGTKQQSYNAELIQILPISFPNKEEQQKIADYFSKLDTLITLHQREYHTPIFGVKQVFTSENTISWEQRKVGELTVESSEYTTLEAGFPLLTSSRNGLMYQNEYRGKQTTDSTETMFSIVPLGACTYRHMSDDDVFHLNVNRLEKGLVSREYPVF